MRLTTHFILISVKTPRHRAIAASAHTCERGDFHLGLLAFAARAGNGDHGEKIGQRHLEAARQPDERTELQVILPALNSADVGPVQIRAFGSLLLGQTLTGPALPHLAPESPTDAVHD